jgi:hypothetical protein
MKKSNFNPAIFLDATELSPLESLQVKGGADKKEKKKEVTVGK